VGAPCATTQRKRCVYNANAPQTPEGQTAWGVFQGQAWKLKTVGLGTVVGVELDVAMRKCVRGGIDEETAEDLLAACEHGLVKALTTKGIEDEQQD
jgi:hypothetical protein